MKRILYILISLVMLFTISCEDVKATKGVLYEIRDYTIEPEWYDRYVYWAENHFIPYAKEKIDIVDFWVDKGIDAEVGGKNPIVSTNGQPNITWVARYRNKNERDAFFESLETDDEWAKVWSLHPKPDAYIHQNARFFKSVK